MDSERGVPFIDEWFSFTIRRNRKSYIFASVMLGMMFAFIMITLAIMFPRSNTGKIIGLLLLLPYQWVSLTLSAQRLRDMNISGEVVLIWFPLFMIGFPMQHVLVAAFFLVLCCYPGTNGSNRYGADPLARRRLLRWGE